MRQKRQKLTSASWLRPVCGGFHNLIRFNCDPFFASCRRESCLDCYMSWCMPMCGLPYTTINSMFLLTQFHYTDKGIVT
jgi:hypothetical protein